MKNFFYFHVFVLFDQIISKSTTPFKNPLFYSQNLICKANKKNNFILNYIIVFFLRK